MSYTKTRPLGHLSPPVSPVGYRLNKAPTLKFDPRNQELSVSCDLSAGRITGCGYMI